MVKSISFKLLVTLYILLCLFLAIYSYTQVDLNLTLSSNSLYQSVQKQLTQVGYFNRDISALIYTVLVFSMTAVYSGLVYQSKSNKVKISSLMLFLLGPTLILLFAYPAFSYDLFNYIFDARILMEHGANPYTHAALDFPSDDWTRFMHWTHRTYPYGPTWLPITLVAYFLGFGKFILTLLSFKLLGVIGYVSSLWALYKIQTKLNPKKVRQSLLLFGFNPLVVIESLVTAHLDALMMGLMLMGIALIIDSRKKLGVVSILVSSGIKYVSGGVILPLYFYLTKKISFNTFIKTSLVLSYVLTVVVISQREILAWYFLVPFGLSALLPGHKIIRTIMIALTPATLIRYAPYLLKGEYTDWVYLTRNRLTVYVFLFMVVAIYSPEILTKFKVLVKKTR